MEFRVLGPLEVLTAGGAVPLTGPKRRALLARFLIDAGRALSAERLADELWHGSPPKSASTTLQTFIYQLRRRYGVEALLTTPAGYLLEVTPDDIDAHRFERTMRDALEHVIASPRAAARELRRALDMWRGAAYEDFATEPWATAEAARLDGLRLDALEAWAASAIGAGETAGVSAELESWTSRAVLREPLWALRMLVLAYEGRPAEALRVATNLRTILRDELGVDPSPRLVEIESAILREEALPPWPTLGGFGPQRSVDAPVVEPSRARSEREPSRLPAALRRAAHTRAPAPSSDLFVGRLAELRALERALEMASNGVPQVAVISGEAGIGKSALLDQFTPHAIARGVQVLIGMCQEDAAVPYLPLASALAALHTNESPFEPERRGDIDVADDGGRLALFLATARALLESAAERVTMLVVEDLHWVDDATLALLRHVLAVVGDQGVLDRARLFVVLTARPTDPASASESFIERLRREQRATVIDVRALTEHECRELVVDWLGERPSRATIDRLYEATGGNPLVLRSAVGRLRAAGGALTDSALLDLVGRTDLDHELWQRVEQMSNEGRDMLLVAAFLGDGATLEFLMAACEVDATRLDELTEEAHQHQVLVADDERFWFAHPQLRQLVYHWPSSKQRAALHLRVAQCLAPIAGDVMVIAHHLVRAGALVEPERLVAICGEAADRSAAVGAWRDAARYAGAALEAAERVDLREDERASMQLRAGHAALVVRDTDVALERLNAAVATARSCGAFDIWGRALLRLAREAVGTPEKRLAATRSLASLDEFLECSEGEASLRAEIHALEAELYFDLGDLSAANRHSASAEDLAREANDDELRVKVGFARGLQHWGSLELAAAEERFDVLRPLAARLPDPSPHIWCTSRLGLVKYSRGALEDAETLLADAIDASRRVDNHHELSMAAAFQTAVAAMRGRFAGAELNADRALRAYRDAPTPFTLETAFPSLAAARAHRGDVAGAHAALDDWDGYNGIRSRRYRPLIDAMAGDVDSARRQLERPTFRTFASMPSLSAILTGAIAAQVELGALTRRPDLVSGPLTGLIELYERGMRFTVGWPCSIARVTALGFAALEDDDQAYAWFERALDATRSAGADAEVARTADDYARVLEHSLAPDDSRILELRKEAADAQSTLIDASPSTVARRDSAEERERATYASTRVILVTDLVASTALNDRLGDRDYVDLLRRHDDIIRRRLAQRDGVEFKHTGDGIGAWFFSVTGALQCATDLARDFAAAPTEPLRVKIALSAGEPMVVDGDLMGLSVTTAFRVLGLAQPGEILVTSDVAGLARGLSWSFEPHGRHPLKGLREAVDVARIVTQAS